LGLRKRAQAALVPGAPQPHTNTRKNVLKVINWLQQPSGVQQKASANRAG
jgi:hypothetical protein